MVDKIVPPAGADFIGITSYKMSPDRPNCFVSTWYSTRLGEPKVLSSGIALGDTSDGFAGSFKIRYYEPNGEPLKDQRPYDLSIIPNGEVMDMRWSRDGKVNLVGIGIALGDQLIASYWRPLP